MSLSNQGANTAAGIQFMGRKIIGDAFLRTYVRPFSSSINSSINDLATFADAPAGREMLAYSTVGTSGNGVGWVVNTFYNQFYIPNTSNVPATSGAGEQIFRFIATSQGDECGVGVVSPGASLFASTGGAGVGVLWGTFGTNIGYEFYMNAANGSNRVLKFRLYNQITLFSWFFGGVTITNNMRDYNIQNPVPSLRLDSQPGGITPIGISFNFNAGFDIGLISFNAAASAISARGFSFVPRNSALDMINPNYVGSLSGAYTEVPSYGNPSKANSFITQEKIFVSGLGTIAGNIAHTTFTYRQTQWLFDEMQKNDVARSQNCAQDCPYPVDAVGGQINTTNTSISGNMVYSTTLPNNYSLSTSVNLNDPAISYQWYVVPSSVNNTSVITFTGQGTPNVTVNNLGSNPALSYSYTIGIRIKTNCWTKTITKFICSGGPKVSPFFPPGIIKDMVICVSLAAYQISFPGATSIVINGNTVLLPTGGSGFGYMINNTGNILLNEYNLVYTITASNACGIGDTFIIRLLRQQGCKLVASTPKNSKINFVISPNPSSGNEITIAQDISKSETSASGEEQPQVQSEAKAEEFTLILYNKLQIKVRETTLNTLSKTISTEGLPNDVYFLHIISKDGNKVVKQVMILR